MLKGIAVVLVVLWLIGIMTGFTMGGFIHVLLIAAVVMVLVRLIRGRPIAQSGSQNYDDPQGGPQDLVQ